MAPDQETGWHGSSDHVNMVIDPPDTIVDQALRQPQDDEDDTLPATHASNSGPSGMTAMSPDFISVDNYVIDIFSDRMDFDSEAERHISDDKIQHEDDHHGDTAPAIFNTQRPDHLGDAALHKNDEPQEQQISTTQFHTFPTTDTSPAKLSGDANKNFNQQKAATAITAKTPGVGANSAKLPGGTNKNANQHETPTASVSNIHTKNADLARPCSDVNKSTDEPEVTVTKTSTALAPAPDSGDPSHDSNKDADQHEAPTAGVSNIPIELESQATSVFEIDATRKKDKTFHPRPIDHGDDTHVIKKAKTSNITLEELLPSISDYKAALIQSLSDVKKELENSSKIKKETIEETAPKLQAMYHCFNRHYLLLRLELLTREFATAPNPVSLTNGTMLPQAEADALGLILKYNHFKTPMQKLLRYWLAYYIFKRIEVKIAAKLEEATAATAKQPGNPKNRAQHDAIQEFAMLNVQELDNRSDLPSLHAKSNHSKWTKVYNLGRRINEFASLFSEDAIWVIPFEDMEAAFGRGLDTANTIYIDVVLQFLKRHEGVVKFLKSLGKLVNKDIAELSKCVPSERVSVLKNIEGKLEDFAKEQCIARSKTPLSVNSVGGAIPKFRSALRASFASNGKSEVIRLRPDHKAQMWATEIESLEPENTPTDEIIRLILEMMKIDGYKIVSSSHFRFLHVSETGDGFWDDKSPEKAYIMPVCIPGDDEEGDDDDDDHGDDDSDSVDEGQEASWGDGATSKERLSTSRYILAQAQRRRPLPLQDFAVTILDSASGSEQQKDIIEQYIRQGLPAGAVADFVFQEAPQQQDTINWGLHAALHGVSLMRCGMGHNITLTAEAIEAARFRLIYAFSERANTARLQTQQFAREHRRIS